MFWFLFPRPKAVGIFSILGNLFQGIKESMEPAVPAEFWENKALFHKDVMNGALPEQLEKNLRNGRYCIPKEQAYPVPHTIERKNGKKQIMIENCDLYSEDVRKYDAYQACRWMKQGKYNLNAEELRIARLQYNKRELKNGRITPESTAKLIEIEKQLAKTNWDYRNAEAVQQWQRAHDAEMRYRC